MISGKNVLALITARGGSKGLPRKNLRPLLGKPLIAWTIEQALTCPEIDAVVVSTDDAEIAEVARHYGAEVPFIRPAELASDSAASIDVVLHGLDTLAAMGRNFEIVMMLEPTSPLREASDLSGAVRRLVATPAAESVVGVGRAEGGHPAYLYRCDGDLLQPYTGRHPTVLRRQDLDSLYFLEGSVYVSYARSLHERKSFYHECTAPWLVTRYKTLEIDELSDLIAAEALLKARLEGQI